MRCPICHSDTKVFDSRQKASTIWRRRECLNCKKRFTTVEEVYKREVKPVFRKGGLGHIGVTTDTLIAMNAKWSVKEIAERFCCSPSAISDRFKVAGHKAIRHPRRRNGKPNA